MNKKQIKAEIQRLRVQRRAHDVTLLTLAKKLGHSVTWVTYRENDYVMPNERDLQRIEEALGEIIYDKQRH